MILNVCFAALAIVVLYSKNVELMRTHCPLLLVGKLEEFFYTYIITLTWG